MKHEKIQIKEFEEKINANGDQIIKYKVIDTVGIEEIDTFGLLKSVIFDADVAKYTTIVRTNFPEFEDELKYQQDQQKLRAENPSIFKILSAIRIIYTDNPPLLGRTASVNQEIRKDLRKRLLVHLATCQGTYRPQNLDTMNDRVGSYMTENEKVLQELKNLKKLSEQQKKLSQEEKKRLIDQIQSLEEKSAQLRVQKYSFDGNGKSTLANVLTNSDEFTESAGSISEARGIQIKEFEERIDLSDDQTSRSSYHIKEGLNQILFVTNGRFTKEEINTFGLLRSVIFDTKVAAYTTIVRTNFPEFEDQDECDKDQLNLQNENDAIFKILRASRVIYIDNPPLKGRSVNTNREIREESRRILLTHLATCQGIYRPENLDDMNDRIGSYMTENERILQELENFKKRSEDEKRLSAEEKSKLNDKIRSLEAQSKNLQEQISHQAEPSGVCMIL
ncbi:1684_t:CDS:2 [Ambispora gerdemannii]|uniref:1684_t:CDS:1 n=1 Tax=Ambispora gerdemannii TaxID=144530 RepID=A0A9N9GN03_9GLOM|nr:1684_t:CDS:2 [Ambispora gerdemannii]